MTRRLIILTALALICAIPGTAEASGHHRRQCSQHHKRGKGCSKQRARRATGSPQINRQGAVANQTTPRDGQPGADQRKASEPNDQAEEQNEASEPNDQAEEHGGRREEHGGRRD